jgi:predicted CoA-binding protein
LRENGHEVIALGFEPANISDVSIQTDWGIYDAVDTVTLYLNPERQKAYYDYILRLNPKRIVFNPGTENKEFEQLANDKGIQVLEACTLVMLRTSQY